MLMFDRITNIDSDGGEFARGSVTAELDLNPDLWFYQCHFIGDPVMPGCLGLDALWQMIGFFLSWSGSPGRGRALGGAIKFVGQATNDKKNCCNIMLILKSTCGRLCHLALPMVG